jgi:hypothetical protein
MNDNKANESMRIDPVKPVTRKETLDIAGKYRV